ncbi:MAG: class I SAM-dependent DNA methyltransferase [Azonexus sp.]|jgi:type II restriction/modification system DNA methylase subunit YeeA|uniref:class I SAM-dependent DNA methyltransferase n=1 Tax=Azonexus sp. TaxID=1872668 RepID=UPI00281DC81B|nr:class I SAM-dependent DNA methyltransferase [Azonexus sp.]MDR0777259.1 class I SAM-dependent DNA methyltransferase [Azonexus sp.]
MTPHQFLAKWRNVELKERTASQSHFNDLCRLLGIEDPIAADPKGEWFTFEKGATKTGGGEGWADVWRKGCFAWEYKGRAANLDKAFDQLLRYSIALESPPLLIVSDMERIRIHTNWTNTVQQVREIALDDLSDAAKRELLRDCFLDPEKLRPTQTRQMLTENAAREFAALAQRLRERGHEAHTVAHFVNRLVFCMFAEDVNLLPNKMFQRMLEATRSAPDQFAHHARTLFGAMKSGGMVGFEKVDWFNGGLFDDDSALPLERADIDNLLAAAKLDWSEIDPSILGTLFERGLDPDKRSQLGAHYTDRDKIMQIVRPVIVEPLQREWAEAKARIEAELEKADTKKGGASTKALNAATAIHREFLERLKHFRILDPACGSGNFLNLGLLALKDIEHRANLEAEALGLQRQFPGVGPENVLGIELNPYAAELARVSVWIGEIQWMRRNGFEASRNPVLRSLNTIENRDALLNADGTEAAWPEADAIVGNPPFLGGSKKRGELGDDYFNRLNAAFDKHVPGGADLVCYWFHKAQQQIEAGKLQAAGLVATQAIRAGSNRNVLDAIVADAKIFEAWSDEPWVNEGAAVRVSLIGFGNVDTQHAHLDGKLVAAINADLTAGGNNQINLTEEKPLAENAATAFEGTKKYGDFDVAGEVARAWLTQPNPNGKNNSWVVKPWANGQDIAKRPSDTWIIDFGTNMPEAEASLFEVPYQYALEHVKPYRQTVKRERTRLNWWRHEEARVAMRRAISPLDRFIATPRVAKHRYFVWLSSIVLPDTRLCVITRSDDATLGILSSRIHLIWALANASMHGVGNDPTYNVASCFETFPFPEGFTPADTKSGAPDTPQAKAIAEAAKHLNALRNNWLNPPEWTDWVITPEEEKANFPKRPVAKPGFEADLKKRTLTNLYNQRPAWLDMAHKSLDEAVATAYGWTDYTPYIPDDEILARLFRLNQERAY